MPSHVTGRHPTPRGVSQADTWLARTDAIANLHVRLGREDGVEQRKGWRKLGWKGSLLVVGALAGGAFAAVGSCSDESKSGALGPSGSAGGTSVGGVPAAFASDQVIVSAA